MEKEIKKISNNSSENSVLKTGIFVIMKKGKIGLFNKNRILYINESCICYYPFPKDLEKEENSYLKTMMDNLKNISGNLNIDITKFKEYVSLFENGLMKIGEPKEKLDFKTITFRNLVGDNKHPDFQKKFKYCVVINGNSTNIPNKNEVKWILDFYSENYFKVFKQIFENIKNPPIPQKQILSNNSNNNLNKNINENKNVADVINNNNLNSNLNNNLNKIDIGLNNNSNNISNNNQQISNEKSLNNHSIDKNNLNNMNKNPINNLITQKTNINNNSNNNNLPDPSKNENIKKKNEESQLIDQSEKILFQEIYFQNLLRVHNYLLVHLNMVNIASNEIDINNVNNAFYNNISNEFENMNQNKDFLKSRQQHIEKNKTLIKNFIMEIEWVIFETYSLFKNFCLGVSKKIVHEFPVENNSTKIFPLLFPAYEKIKTSKYGAFFYYLTKINVHFTLTWDKVACKNEKKGEKNISNNNPNMNKNEDNKKRNLFEDFSVYFNGKWKNLRKEFKNRDFFIDLISFFNSKATRLDKFPCIPMTCIIDYHGFRIYCESIVPKNENNKQIFYKNQNNQPTIDSYFNNPTERQRYEGYFKSTQDFSKEFHNLDTKRRDINLDNEAIENSDFLNNNNVNKDKKENKQKFDIKYIENLFVANTRNLNNFYNFIIPPKNSNTNNIGISNQNDKDFIKLVNEKFEKITFSYYNEIQKKIDDYISILRENSNNNSNNFNNLNNINNTQNINTGFNYIEDNNDKFPSNINKKLNLNNLNEINNLTSTKPLLDLSFLDNLYENLNDNSNDDSRNEDNFENSNIIDGNNNYLISGINDIKKSKIHNVRPTNINMRINYDYSKSNFPNASNYNNLGKNSLEDDNSLINEGNLENYEHDFQNFRFLEDILDQKTNEEDTNKINNNNNFNYMKPNASNNNIINKNQATGFSKEKEKNTIYLKIFKSYAKFNKYFELNSKKSVDYNNNYINTISNKNENEASKKYIQEDIYIYTMKYNFLITNSPEEKIFNNSEKEKRGNNQNFKFPYHYFRPEYLFYFYKLFEDNLESNRNLTEEEKNNKKKLSDNFNLFLKEILMHNTSDSKSKNLDEFITYYNEKHIYYFTKSLDNLYHIPLDSEQLTEIFHANGINMFCLGKVAQITNVPHVRELCIIEMIARICKRYIYQYLTSKKISTMNRFYATDKMYDTNILIKKESNNQMTGNSNINPTISNIGIKDKENSDLANKANINQFIELIPTNSFFKFGSANSLSEVESAINPSTKQSLKKYDIDPKNIKNLLTEPYISDAQLNVNINSNSASNINNSNINLNNNEINLKSNRGNSNNPNLSTYSSVEEMKDIVKFLNVLFDLVNPGSSLNNNSTSNNISSVNNFSNLNSNMNANPNQLGNSNQQILIPNNPTGTNNPNNFNGVNAIISTGFNNINVNKAVGPDEIEIFDERLNHNKLWNKIIEEIKKKFYLDNDYILDMIKNKYFSIISLFHAILRNSGIKYIGEPKHICEDMYNFSGFLELKDSVFQVQPKIKGFKFRNFLSNRVFKNTNLNIFDEAFFIDEFKNRNPVKNLVFRNFVEQLSYSQSDFTEFSLIFLDSLNKIAEKKFPIEVFESIIINMLKKFDKERNIASAHVNNKGAYGKYGLNFFLF